MDEFLPLGPLTRSETIKALGCMGVDTPADTKLADESLDKRLRDALNAAQYKDRFSLPFDFDKLGDWPIAKPGDGDIPNERRLLLAVQRGNMSEAELTRARGRAPELYVDPVAEHKQAGFNSIPEYFLH